MNRYQSVGKREIIPWTLGFQFDAVTFSTRVELISLLNRNRMYIQASRLGTLK